MKKDLIFLGEQGLTSTSANHIANLAKEYIQDLESCVNNISFYDSKVTIIGNNNYNVLSTGTTTITNIPDILNSIARAKSLIAWLREAIKAKDNLIKEVNRLTLDEYCTLANIERPILSEMEETITEDEYIATLSIKERNRYYELETLCAVYGKYIHPNGLFADARKTLLDKIQHPHAISGSGRDALLYTYTPTVSTEDVEDLFFNLQNTYREYQAELNGIKHKMSEAIIADEAVKTAKYAEAYETHKDLMATINAKLKAYKVTESKRISDLKIVIPNSLSGIYETINGLGK